MPKVTVEIEGAGRVQRKLRVLAPETRKAVGQAVQIGTLLIDREAKLLIQRSPASGETYEKYLPRRTHTASAPGQPPATDTGGLVRSIVPDVDLPKLTGTVSARIAYAKFLEFGTNKMEARPFLGPAFNSKKREIVLRIARAVKETARRVSRDRRGR